jgi:hypothetical protein
MSDTANEFQEIAHCGGQFTVDVSTNEHGSRQIQVGMRHSRPVPAAFFSIYALPQGIPIATLQITGEGGPSTEGPIPDSYPIFIGADARGMFGRECPHCKGYWRSTSSPERWLMTCAYCGLRLPTYRFLTPDQRRYIKACCDLVNRALESEEDKESIIDMDEVADAIGKDSIKPPLYYVERSQ